MSRSLGFNQLNRRLSTRSTTDKDGFTTVSRHTSPRSSKRLRLDMPPESPSHRASTASNQYALLYQAEEEDDDYEMSSSEESSSSEDEPEMLGHMENSEVSAIECHYINI